MIEREFLDQSADTLLTLSGRIQDCLGRLSAEQIWARGSDQENAAGNLVLHLCGNLGQWILSGLGGQPDMRDRDAEFAARGGLTADDLKTRLRTRVEEAAAVIRAFPPNRLGERKLFQKHFDSTMLGAIFHVVEHFAQHTGQIIFLTKLTTSSDLGYYKFLNKPAATPR